MLHYILAIVVLYLVYRRFYVQRMDPWAHIPGPPLLPIIQHLPFIDLNDFGKSANEFRKQYGDVCKMCLPGFKPWILINNVEDVKSLFQNHMEYNRGSMYDLAECVAIGGPKSIDALNPKDWAPLRQVMNKAFSSNRIRWLSDITKQKTEKFILSAIEQNYGHPTNLDQATNYWSMEIMSTFAFGYEEGAKVADSQQYVLQFFYDALPIIPYFHFWKYLSFLPSVRKLRQANQTVYEVIRASIENKSKNWNPEDKDILSLLLNAEVAGKIDQETLEANCFFILVAGDTTPCSLISFLYYMSVNPAVQERLIDELREKIGDKDATLEDTNQCDYLIRCIKECLRMAPPVRSPAGRTNHKDVVMSGITIPAGSDVCYTTYSLHYNEKYWPEPEKFNPDRFLDPDVNLNAWIPFMLGGRNCLGQHVAMMELKHSLVQIFRKYSVTLDKTYTLRWRNSLVVCPQEARFVFKKLDSI